MTNFVWSLTCNHVMLSTANNQEERHEKEEGKRKREREKKERKSGMIREGIKERERMRNKKRNNICHSKYFIEICLQELFYIFSGCYTLYVLSDLQNFRPSFHSFEAFASRFQARRKWMFRWVFTVCAPLLLINIFLTDTQNIVILYFSLLHTLPCIYY